MAVISFPLVLTGESVTRDSYPLDDVNAIALDLGSLLNKQANVVMLERGAEAEYQILATYPNYGSFEQQLIISLKDFAAHHPLVLAMSVVMANINAVFSLYDNIKKRLPSKPKLEKSADDQIILTGNKEEALKIEPDVFQRLVEEPEFRRIIERLSPKRIQSLEFGEGRHKIKITGSSENQKTWREIGKLKRQFKQIQNELASAPLVGGLADGQGKDRYSIAAVALERPVELIGRIRAVDLDGRSGRILIDEGSKLPAGEFDFILAPGLDVEILPTHLGGRVQVTVDSTLSRGLGMKTALILSKVNRLGLASASAY